MQPEPAYYERFKHIDDPDRRANVAMVALMDDAVGDVVAALRARGLWDETLLLWSSDNGGAVHLGGGSNTFPLRGGYYNNWEGGIRAAAFLAGGFLPADRRGSRLESPIHICDWHPPGAEEQPSPPRGYPGPCRGSAAPPIHGIILAGTPRSRASPARRPTTARRPRPTASTSGTS